MSSTQRQTPPRSTSLRAEARIHSRQHPWNRRRSAYSPPVRASRDTNSSHSGSARSATDSSIFKGAEILRQQLERQQQEKMNDVVLRGAASVKAQLLSEKHRVSPVRSIASDDWSDPWETKSRDHSEATHPQTSETSSSADVSSRLSTPHSDDFSRSLTPPSDETDRFLPREFDENFDDVRRSLPMGSPKRSHKQQSPQDVRMRRFERSIDDDDNHDSHLSEKGNASEWKRKTSNDFVPQPLFQGEVAVVYSDDDSDDEEMDEPNALHRNASHHSSGQLDEMGFPIINDDLFDYTDSSAASTEPPPAPKTPPPPPPPDEDPETPVTLMGRGNSLKFKIHTYNVQRTEDLFTDSDTYSDQTYSTIESPSSGTKSSGSCDDLVYSMSLEETPSSRESSGRKGLNDITLSTSSSSYLPDKYSGRSSRFDDSDDDYSFSSFLPTQLKHVKTSPAISPRVVSPMTETYSKLAEDPAYRHAQRAGLLWQTLASQQVRFPSHWWDGARSPQMGMMEDYSGNGKAHCDWKYIASHRVYSNPQLKRLVRNRASPGRLLLHIVVRDLITHLPAQDIAIGCFHPNARGVRKTVEPNPNEEECREVWMAIRRRSDDGSVSAVDRYLTRGRSLEEISHNSPLRGKPRVSNQNMRAVSACLVCFGCRLDRRPLDSF